MKFKAVLLVSTLFAALLSLTPPLTTFACIPNEDGTRCEAMHLFKAHPTVVVARPTAIAVAAPVKRGSGPGDALEMTDAQQYIEPGQNIWYQIGSGPNRQHFVVFLDASGQKGIGFATFAPDQMADWTPATPPKGRGAYDRTNPAHDLTWNANAPAGGTWFVVVTNYTSLPIAYKLTSSASANDPRNCTPPYWEPFPNGTSVLWPGLCN